MYYKQARKDGRNMLKYIGPIWIYMYGNNFFNTCIVSCLMHRNLAINLVYMCYFRLTRNDLYFTGNYSIHQQQTSIR